jgi:hypothetical protein
MTPCRGTQRVADERGAEGSFTFRLVLEYLHLHPIHTLDRTIRVQMTLALDSVALVDIESNV